MFLNPPVFSINTLYSSIKHIYGQPKANWTICKGKRGALLQPAYTWNQPGEPSSVILTTPLITTFLLQGANTKAPSMISLHMISFAHVMVQSVSLLGVGDVWWPSEECKHELTLGRVLTAATPWLEQRFDADLKEYGILKAQHGVPPSYGSGQETIFTWLFPQFCLSKVWLHWDVIKKEMYIIHIWGFPLDQRWKLPSTGDR